MHDDGIHGVELLSDTVAGYRKKIDLYTSSASAYDDTNAFGNTFDDWVKTRKKKPGAAAGNRANLRGGADDRNCFADMLIEARQLMFGVVRNRISMRGGGDEKV